MPRRRAVLPLVLAAAACAAAALPLAGLAAPGDDLPDLRADPPRDPYPQVYSDGRLLLRFDGFVTNVGTGPLDVNGNPNGVMWQRVNDGGTLVNDHQVPVQYETADGHNHFHLMRIMRYSLWNAARTAEVAPGQKVGFCLYDYNHATNFSGTRDPEVYALGRPGDDFCRRNNPAANTLNMGVSSGWRDDYEDYLALQWVDISDTAPGNYYLAADADPNNIIRESNESNPRAYTSFTVPVSGYLAKAIGPLTASGSVPTTIPLASDAFGSPDGGVVYKVTKQPNRGSVSIAGGTAIYTPGPGSPGTYSFQYSASAAGSVYPRTPRTATATLQVGSFQEAGVTISGAPASLKAGTSAQLSAAVVNATPGVTWTTTAGTVSPTGLFVAPSTVPPGGTVTVTARSTQVPSAFAQAVIAIEAVGPAKPAPLPAGGSTSSNGLLAPPHLKRNGRNVVVRTATTLEGKLTVTAIRNGKALARCRKAASAGVRVTCLIRLPRRVADKTVRIAVGLKAADGTRATARAIARAA